MKVMHSSGTEKSAARRLAETFSAETLDSLIKDAVKSGTPIDGADGLLNELTKAVLERSLQTEMTHHLGYEPGDPAGRGSGNSRNGSSSKTVTTVSGPVEVAVPRDRNGCFESVIVPKRARRLSNINSVVLSSYSRGMTTRDIEAHLEEVYGAAVSRELISNVTEVVVDEIKAWQSRPLDEGRFLAIVVNQVVTCGRIHRAMISSGVRSPRMIRGR
jgi:putative transposase